MAGLSQGQALVVGAGRLTEPVWSEERCVALAPSPSPADLIQAAESCLADPAERARLGEAAPLHLRTALFDRANRGSPDRCGSRGGERPRMSRPYVLVTGDFVLTGGMDRANYALASYLAGREGAEVHLVAHRAADDLTARPGVTLAPGASASRKPSAGLPATRPRGSELGEAALGRWGAGGGQRR